MFKNVFYLSWIGLIAAGTAYADLPCQPAPEGGPAFIRQTPSVKLPRELDEISGMALSRRNPKYLWAHVDSDGAPNLYALDKAGNIVQTYVVDDVKNIDWEDVAVGPCDRQSKKSCIYIADTGDNRSRRKDKSIIVIEEPDVQADVSAAEKTRHLSPVTSIPVVFPDAGDADPRFSNPDCETLMVHPITGDIYLISKQTSGAAATLYRVPRNRQKIEKLSSHVFKDGLGNLFPLYNAVTGADFSPDARRFAVRTYSMIYECDLERFSDVPQAFAHPVARFESVEIQGESITYDADGISLITSGERFTSPYATMNRFLCRQNTGE